MLEEKYLKEVDTNNYKMVTISGSRLSHHNIDHSLDYSKLGAEKSFDLVILQGGSGETNSSLERKVFADIASEALLFLLEQSGVFASAASSCSSGAQEPSHVLSAMGYQRELARGSLRLSLGYRSTQNDVDRVLEILPNAIQRLRSLGS